MHADHTFKIKFFDFVSGDRACEDSQVLVALHLIKKIRKNGSRLESTAEIGLKLEYREAHTLSPTTWYLVSSPIMRAP